MKICVFPGSFDPFTLGHLDVLRRACALFDRVFVGVLINAGKHPVFSETERVALIEAAARGAGLINCAVERFDGLLVEYCRQKGAAAIVRGLRSASDYEYERQLAAVNHQLAPEIETVFLTTAGQFSALSSSIVREVGRYGGSIAGMVPPESEKFIAERLRNE